MQKAVHLKTGNVYDVIGTAMNATNKQDGQKMVVYGGGGQVYVREYGEFHDKFRVLVDEVTP